MNEKNLNAIFANNRTEELGFDVWKQFVIPPFFNRLELGSSKKPKVIIGGRGCGKTMLLRYLSHETSFSRNRTNIPSESINHIGLYWRADTQFAQLMEHRGLKDITWYSAFEHLAAVLIGAEIIRSLENIMRSSLNILSEEDFKSINLGRLGAYDDSLPSNPQKFRENLEDKLSEFEAWVSNIKTAPQPKFLPGKKFLIKVISLIQEQIPSLRQAIFFVYIDEYENLATYQQKLVNTWLKHSEPPLIFNMAMKRNGFKTTVTVGDESLSKIHDYRTLDLEDYGVDMEFPIFAAEILLLKLNLASMDDTINPNSLRDPNFLSERSKNDYGSKILEKVRQIFPSLTEKQMAESVFDDKTLRERLGERIKKGLKGKNSKAPISKLIRASQPAASIVVSALVYRDSVTIDEICDELDKLEKGDENRFTGSTNWIHNNFIGCYLQLYDGLTRPCPVYGGFNTFCYLSRGNLRHFLELCHQSISKFKRNNPINLLEPISIEHQAEAARQVAANLLTEVKSFGPLGNNMYTVILRLGSAFSLSQQRPSQSEPERNHFSIKGGDSELSEQQRSFLAEAVKWSVLFEEKETKKKSATEPESPEYVLNPIYSPFFHISYRKKRKLELTAKEVSILIGGTYEEVKEMLLKFKQEWEIDLSYSDLPLFSHLYVEKQNGI